MKQFVYQTILENRHEEYEKSENPSKVTFKKPIFLNHNAIHQKANPNESNSPRKRPQTPLVHFVTPNDSANEGGSEERLTPRIPQVEMLTKQNFFKPEERKFIRRKSCCCQCCGGISSLETKHQDLVTDIESYGRKRLTQVEESQVEPQSESPTRKSGLSALKQAVRRQKTLNSFFTAIKKENSKSQILPDLALKLSKSSFPRNSPALSAIAKETNKLLLSTRKSQDVKFEGKPSMKKDPSLLELGGAIQEYQPDDHGRALKSRKKSEGISIKLTSLKLLKNDDSPVSSKDKKDMKNLFKKKTRYSTTDLNTAYTLRQTYNMSAVPSTPTLTKISLTSRAGNRDGIFSSTQTSFPKSLNTNGKIVEEADCQSSYLESDREIRSALSDRIKIDSMTTRKSKIIEFVGPIPEIDNDFGLSRNGTNKFYDNVARRLSIKSKGLKTEPDLGYNSRDKNERIRSIYLDDKASLLTSPSSRRNLVKIKSPHNASNKVQTLQDVQPNKLKIIVKPKGRASEVKEFPKEFQISPLLSEAKKQKSGIKSRHKISHLPTLTTDFSMFNKSTPQIQSATLAINKKAF